MTKCELIILFINICLRACSNRRPWLQIQKAIRFLNDCIIFDSIIVELFWSRNSRFHFIRIIQFFAIFLTRSLPRVTYVWHYWLPIFWCTSWLQIINWCWLPMLSTVDYSHLYVLYVYKWICPTYYIKTVARKA